jgi:integrase
MAKSAPVQKTTNKPKKPYPDFPLFPHATRRWAKKIRGRLHYFGPWDDPDAALDRYIRERDDLYAGRKPRDESTGASVADLCNRFLTAKQHLLDTSELAQCTFDDYFSTCSRIVRVFGRSRLVNDLRSDDFECLRSDIAKTYGLVALGNEVNRVRVVFNYAYNADLVDRPVKFGPDFKRPSKRSLRIERQKSGPRMFEAAQIRQLLTTAHGQMRGMILLGINCGFGNADVGRLRESHVDLDSGWVDFPRPKTGIKRRCALWDETATILEELIRANRASSIGDDLIFRTKYGQSWYKETGKDSPISNEFRKLIDSLEMYRKGLTFYAMRHTFETIAGECRDQIAVDHVMGHARDDMSTIYRERISDQRLKAVTDYVHQWLFVSFR